MNVQGDGSLQIRWSPSCRAVWARFNVYGGLSNVTKSAAPIVHINVAIVKVPQKPQGKADQAYGDGASYWSGMVEAGGKVCAMVERFFGDPKASATRSTMGTPRSLGWTSTCI